MNRQKGFSLMETLVVVSIAGLVTAISIPVLQKAKMSADETVCASKLQQWGMICNLYATDNEGFMERAKRSLEEKRGE